MFTKRSSDDFDFNTLQSELISAGAWKVLPADLSSVPAEQRQGFPRALSISVAVDLKLVNRLAIGVDPAYCDEYDRLNGLLDRLASLAEEKIRAAGFSALALTRDRVAYSYQQHATVLPHKTVATRAALGWIGKNALLITKERGGSVRLISVLTDAPLVTPEPINVSLCGSCTACLSNCPGKAPKGPNWTIEADREEFFDMLSCRRVCLERTWKVKPGYSLCGLCIAVCPYTRIAIEQEGNSWLFPVPEFATLADLPAILALQKLAFHEEGLRCDNMEISPLTQSLDELADQYSDQSRPMVILKLTEDRRIIGSVRAYEKDGTAYIDRLVVHPDYQKRGYGKRLMKSIESCYHGARFELFTGEESLENIRFYEGLGYRRFDVKEFDKVRLAFLEKKS